MKIDFVKKKYNLTEENLEKIKAEVAKAENGTSGELVFAITPSSSFYVFWEIFASFIMGLISFAIMIPLSSKIENFIKSLFWTSNFYSVPLFMFSVTLIVTVLSYLLFNTPFFDRILVPSKIMNLYCKNKALRTFVLSDVYSTEKDTGVLVFVSLLEKNVQVICDKGILKTTSQDEWDKIANELASGFSKKDPTSAIISTIQKCGLLFKENFSLKENQVDKNELSDGIVFIEGGEL